MDDLRRRLRHAARRALSPLGLELQSSPPFLRRARAWRPPQRALATMTAEMLRPVPLGPPQAAPQGGLIDLWRLQPRTMKYHHYFAFYEELFAPLRAAPIRLLEIGVAGGGSLRMWQAWLHPGSVVVGLDIDPRAAGHADPEAGRHVRIGDQSDPAFLAEVTAAFGPFDVVIDDGSHVASHMIASFNHLFLQALKPGGIYLVEDTHSNYWNVGHRDTPYVFTDYAKDLTDFVNWHYTRHDNHAFLVDDPARLARLELPRLAAELVEIRFRDSLIAFRRAASPALPVMEITPGA